MLKRRDKIIWFFISAIIVGDVLYIAFGQSILENILSVQENSLLNTLVYTIYPRLDVEIQRHSASYFTSKAHQVVLRWNLFLLLALVILKFYDKNILQLKRSVNEFTQMEVQRKHVRFITFIFYAGLFLFSKDWLLFLTDYHAIVALYEPTSFYNFLPFPSLLLLNICWIVYIISIVFVLCWVYPLHFSVLSTVLFLYLQGLLYCFEKTNHAFATLGYAALLMPWLVYEQRNAKRNNTATHSALPILVIQLSIGVAYFQSGLEKILNAGVEWMKQETLPTMGFYEVELTSLLLFGALLFQFTFILFIWHNYLKWFYLLLGLLFHVGTVVWISVGAILNPWLFVYSFWLIPTNKPK